MALVFADRVLETTTTTGTGALTLAGAIAGFRAFSAVLTSPSDTCYYTIFAVDANGNPTGDWETGLGTYSGANTLTRTTPSAGSAATPVSFAAGTKRVGIVPVASGPPFSWVGSDGLASLTTSSDGDISLGTNCALTISQNGGVLRIANTSLYSNIQSYGGRPLRINPAGNNIELGAVTSVTGSVSTTLGYYIPHVASPGTPAADNLLLMGQRVASSGGHVMPRYRSEDGVYMTVAPHTGRNSILRWQASGGTAVNNDFGATVTAIGTATARNPATTNRLTESVRTAYVSASTAGQAAGLHVGSAAGARYTLGSSGRRGFRAFFRWGCSDAAAVSGAHFIAGMRSSTATPTVTAAPSSLTNAFGVAQNSGSTNLQLVQGGSAASAAVDLGANFPAAGLSTDMYELVLYARPDVNNSVTYRLERINTGDVAQGTLTAATPGTQLPANTTFLGPILWRSNNATALAVGLDINSMQMEADLV